MNDTAWEKKNKNLQNLQLSISIFIFLGLFIPPYSIKHLLETDLVQTKGFSSILLMDLLFNQRPYGLPPFVPLIKASPLLIAAGLLVMQIIDRQKDRSSNVKLTLGLSAAGLFFTSFHNSIFYGLALFGWQGDFWGRFLFNFENFIVYMLRLDRVLFTTWFFLILWGALLVISLIGMRLTRGKKK